jgi:hypothetical protein
MKKWLLLILLTFSFQALAEEGPIHKHLSDATKINRARALKYARLSGGKSFLLSYQLIGMENLAKIVTSSIDKKSLKYEQAGVALFSNDLVNMSYTPEFSPTFGELGPPKTRITIELREIRKTMLDFFSEENFCEIYRMSLSLLEEGPLKERNQNCLTRHFVESIARSVLNYEAHRVKAREHGMDDPKPLLLSFLRTQISSLRWAYSLDKRAYSIQEKNIPLFCNDVPAIPYK